MSAAVDFYRKAISINPDYAEAHYNLAILWLFMLNFKDGWAQYEWRWKATNLVLPAYGSVKSVWNGNRIENRLLVLSEQGIGDQILYSSVFNELGQRGKSVTVALPKKLISLYSRSYPEFTFIDQSEEISDTQFDEIIPMASLMQHFRPDTSAFKLAKFPYLEADQESVAKFKATMKSPKKISCGIAWTTASRTLAGDKGIPVGELSPIIALDKYEFFNLQFGDIASDLEDFKRLCKKEIHKFDGVNYFDDIDSVSAIIQACDLVVTSSNTVAHIAGALNKVTILILPYSVGKLWYWQELNGFSFWYPSVKIFSQKVQGNWNEVINRAKEYMERLDFES